MRDLKSKNRKIDRLGFMTIGAFSLSYVLFHKFFAELHIQFSFLNFPIFAGEWLLIFCIILFFTKCKINKRKPNHILHYVLIAYAVFVLGKALYGFVQWGPLALRHAALFYYPFFAVFGYTFYRRDFFSRKMCILLLLIILSILVIEKFYGYWIFTLLMLGCILITTFPRKILKFVVMLFLFLCAPYREFFQTSRMMILSNFVSSIYLAGTLPMIIKISKRLKLVLALILGSVVLIGILTFANQHAVRTIVDIRKMAGQFQAQDSQISAIGAYEFDEREMVKLYKPDITNYFTWTKKDGEGEKIGTGDLLKAEIRQVLIELVREKIEHYSFGENYDESHRDLLVEVREEIISMLSTATKTEILGYSVESVKSVDPTGESEKRRKLKMDIRNQLIEYIKTEIQMASVHQVKVQIPPELINEVKREAQLLFAQEINKNIPGLSSYVEREKWGNNQNAIFRLLIWRDMLVELAKEKPILGFDFGKSLRSISLEALEWGSSEWARDGWVGAHNSYLHITYRTGIIGILLIVSLLIILFKMIGRSVREKSFTGIFLCGIIINWFVAANFLLIFELPYTAIPIWTLYGLTIAHCYKTQNENPNRS